jgi:hypothetical protein
MQFCRKPLKWISNGSESETNSNLKTKEPS